MSRSKQIALASVLALALTYLGFWFELGSKLKPLDGLVWWFPFGLIFGLPVDMVVVMSLLQFPLLAVAFGYGINRWRTRDTLLGLGVAYILAVGVSYAMLRFKFYS